VSAKTPTPGEGPSIDAPSGISVNQGQLGVAILTLTFYIKADERNASDEKKWAKTLMTGFNP
jgi:hypothetical protein